MNWHLFPFDAVLCFTAKGEMVMKKLTTIYKITDKDGKTRSGEQNETQWGVNITHTTSGDGQLCGPGWLHGYHHPLLAVLLNPVHGEYDPATMKLWRCKAIVGIREADKLGCTKITTIVEIPIPVIGVIQRIAFALIVAKDVYKDEKFKIFADNWLSGKDRTADAASAAHAASAAYAAADAAYAAYAAANAANAAANAAYAAANAAYAAYAADAAASAAYAAANAADAENKLTDEKLLAFAKRALKVE